MDDDKQLGGVEALKSWGNSTNQDVLQFIRKGLTEQSL
jgi:hypothetical protein